MLSIGLPLLTGIAITLTLGVILIAAGVAQLVFAFKSKSFGEGAVRFLFGGLAILASLALFAQPGAGLATITVFFAAWFVVDGIWSLMGKPLNLSPFMIILPLNFRGQLWGIPGMFLSVPITVMFAIVCAHFRLTRGLAIILSGDGNVTYKEGQSSS